MIIVVVVVMMMTMILKVYLREVLLLLAMVTIRELQPQSQLQLPALMNRFRGEEEDHRRKEKLRR